MPNSPSIDKCPCLEVQGRASQKSVGHKSVQFVRDTTNGHGPEKSPLFPSPPPQLSIMCRSVPQQA